MRHCFGPPRPKPSWQPAPCCPSQGMPMITVQSTRSGRGICSSNASHVRVDAKRTQFLGRKNVVQRLARWTECFIRATLSNMSLSMCNPSHAKNLWRHTSQVSPADGSHGSHHWVLIADVSSGVWFSGNMQAFSSTLVHLPLVPAWLCFRCCRKWSAL